jgi:hypothetical protein
MGQTAEECFAVAVATGPGQSVITWTIQKMIYLVASTFAKQLDLTLFLCAFISILLQERQK